MKLWVLSIAAVLPASVMADSCVAVEGAEFVNACKVCMEATVQEMRPRGEQAAGLFTGNAHTVRAEPGLRAALGGSGKWVVSDLRACR